MNPTPLYIQALQTAVPGSALTQDEAVERMRVVYPDERTHRLLRRLTRHTSINQRHLAAMDWQDTNDPLYLPRCEGAELGPGMGVRSERFDRAIAELVPAAVGRLDQSALAEIRSLITISCTHASSPGLEGPLFKSLPIPRNVSRWNLGFMGCSAGLSGLRLARQLEPGQQAALLVTCELSSLHFQYHPAIDQMTANMLFADGCAAALLSSEAGPVAVRAARAVHLPEHADQMVWFADDHGLRLHLSQELPDTLGNGIGQAVDDFLAEAGLTRADIANWLVHPGGPQILDSVEQALALPTGTLDLSRGVLRDYGNMSSTTVFFILQRMVAAKAKGPCVAMAFGPGLTIELVLLELSGNDFAAIS